MPAAAPTETPSHGIRPRRATATAALLLAAALLSGCPDSDPGSGAAPAPPPPGAPAPTGAPAADSPDAAVKAALAARPDLARNRVVVLGLDGCDPRLVRELATAGRLPNFRRLMEEGAFGPLQSQQPMLSPLLWTTVATGKWPTEHGVLDFMVQAQSDPAKRETVTSRQRQVEAIWDIVGRFGRTVGVVGWLASHPADRVNGFAVSERTELLAYLFNQKVAASDEGKTWPPDLLERIQPLRRRPMDIPFAEVKPFLAITEEEYRDACRKDEFTNDNRTNNLRIMLAGADNFRRIGASLRRDRKPSLACHYFELLDAVGHNFMAYREPITWKPRELEEVLDALRGADPPVDPGVVEKIWRRTREPEAGAPPLALPGIDPQRVADIVELSRGAEPAKVAKWKGAVDAAYEWTDRLLGEVMAEADPDTILLVLSDHGFAWEADKPLFGKPTFDSSFNSKRGGASYHTPIGVLGVWGKGVRRGFAIPPFEKTKEAVGARLIDIAPTVLALQGFPKAKDMPGRVLTEVFDLDLAVGSVESYERDRAARLAKERVEAAAKRPAGGEGRDATEESELEDAMRQLTAVGYTGTAEEGPVRAMLHMAASYEQQERWPEAEEAFREALKSARGPVRRQVHAGLGRMRLRQGDPEGALKLLGESLKEAPEDPLLALRGMAEAHEARGDQASAVGCWEKIVALHTRVPAFKFHLAEALRKKAVSPPGPATAAELSRARGLILEAARPPEGGEPDLEKLGPVGNNQLGMVLLDMGDYDGAVRAFQSAASRSAEYVRPRNNLAVAHMRLGFNDLRAASEEKDAAKRGALLKSSGAHRTEALRWFGQVLGIQPDNARAHYNRAEVHLNFPPQDLEAAEADLEAALKAEPGYRRAKALLDEVRKARAKGPPAGGGGSPPKAPR